MTRRIALALLLLAFMPIARGQAPQAYEKADKADAAARAEVERQGLVNLVVVVIDDDRVAWAQGYGFADLENHVPASPGVTQYRWASISKPITAIAALQLYEKGRLDLDADVRTYVPEFPDKGARITPRQLLCHQGGIVHYSNGRVIRTPAEYKVPHPFEDVITALDTFKDSPLVNRPGAKYSYSTHGFMLLSAVVQRAGQERFADQVRDRISGPLGMTGFQPDYEWVPIAHRAVGYRKDDDGDILRRPDAQAPDVSWKLGGGGFTSTAIDMARFALGLIDHKLVAESTEQLMWTVQHPSDPESKSSYGLGFSIGKAPDGTRRIGHNGSQEKARTQMLLEPTRKRGVVVMTSSEWADPNQAAKALLDAIR
ncbi:MAG: serine hydrolase domain-containing protein [Isosphaeraceae bacterium]